MRPTSFERLGGAVALRRLVERFYDIMDEWPEAAPVRGLHAQNLDDARERLYCFLSGWMGGPPLYQQRYGPPMLRARHLPFTIGSRERDLWLALRSQLEQSFFRTADHMRNQT